MREIHSAARGTKQKLVANGLFDFAFDAKNCVPKATIKVENTKRDCLCIDSFRDWMELLDDIESNGFRKYGQKKAIMVYTGNADYRIGKRCGYWGMQKRKYGEKYGDKMRSQELRIFNGGAGL